MVSSVAQRKNRDWFVRRIARRLIGLKWRKGEERAIDNLVTKVTGAGCWDLLHFLLYFVRWEAIGGLVSEFSDLFHLPLSSLQYHPVVITVV